MTAYSLKIADYLISFNGMSEGLVFAPGEAQKEFMCQGDNYDLIINVFRGPVVMNEQAVAVFTAPYVEEIDGIRVKKNDEFWTVYKLGDYILIRTTCPLSDDCREAMLVIRPEEKCWDLIIDTDSVRVDPWCYPVDGLVLYYLTAVRGDIFLHGSGVEYRGYGYAFSGVSGRGKTTIAGLFRDAGARVVHDDRLILRNINGRYYMYNTPVYIGGKAEKAALDTVLLIDHGRDNIISGMSNTEAIAGIMANCIQHHWNAEFIGVLTGSLMNLVNSVSVLLLDFVPDRSVVECIESI